MTKGAYRKHTNLCLWYALCLVVAIPLDPALERPVGWLGLLVPLLVWPHFSSNTSITAGVAALALHSQSMGGLTVAGARRTYAARLSGA
jgi:hypothetical protein